MPVDPDWPRAHGWQPLPGPIPKSDPRHPLYVYREDPHMPFRSRVAPENAVEGVKTVGLSPKTVLAFLFPTVASVGGALSQYVGTGQLDTQTIRVAGAGLVLSAIGALGAWLGQPGTVVKP